MEMEGFVIGEELVENGWKILRVEDVAVCEHRTMAFEYGGTEYDGNDFYCYPNTTMNMII
jgi:hypothetical protein